MYLQKYSSLISNKIINIFLILCFFTVSFDIFLIFDFGPNLRIFQLLSFFIIFISFFIGLYKPYIIPLGFIPLLIWTIFIFAFIPNSGFLPKGIGYAFWLLLNIMFVFSMVQIINSKNFNHLFFWYLTSFFFVSLFGLIQFIAGFLGFGDLFLIKTWWYHGIIPRINGFSYEPSFYSTYLITGWFILACLKNNKIPIFNSKFINIYYYVISISIILSGSRLGLLVILIWYARIPFIILYRLVFLKKIYLKNFYFGLFVIVIISIVLFTIFFNNNFSILTSGLNYADNYQSITIRLKSFIDTLTIFYNSPFIGYSLGGISSAIAELNGLNVDSFASAKIEGNCVLAEVLAASGIFGFFPFLFFIWMIFYKPFIVTKNIISEDFSQILLYVTCGTIIQFLMLQANQNILRPYLWLNIGFICVLYKLVVTLRRYK